METFGKICFTILALIFTTIVGGLVFMELWNWIIVPIFLIQKLGLIQSIAITFFIVYIKPHKKSEEKFSMKLVYKAIEDTIVQAILYLTLGYLISLFL